MQRIWCDKVCKSFHRRGGQQLMRDYIKAWWSKRGQQEREKFLALRDVSFTVNSGESVAIIGRNGAGKSTLLSVVAGLAPPDSGRMEITGRVAALMELGSGFHPDLTGRENIRLNAALLGLTEKQTNEAFDTIVEFSGLDEFIDEPLKTYSSGMSMRLAFSVAVNLHPDILIVDEVIAVGDRSFQEKCFERIHLLRRAGKTLLCVSHAPSILTELCDRALWLDHGQLMMDGTVSEVLSAYQGCIAGSVT
ncbi:MAG: ABC transporter ATP-binding protein [Bryobacteraceae bacterium]|nr:ABC transporter ATP-binding protein [Bryobacteraceae bacterium]